MRAHRRLIVNGSAVALSLLLAGSPTAQAARPASGAVAVQAVQAGHAAAAAVQDTSVAIHRPTSGLIDKVLHGVATLWSWSEWVNLYTGVKIDDPSDRVAQVTATYLTPAGGTLAEVALDDEGAGEWSYNPDSYASGGDDGHAEYGTWVLRVAAYDADGALLDTATRRIESRDPMTAAHPRLLSIHTKKRQTRRPRACPRDTDHHRYCQIRAVLRVSDPDRLLGYAFMSDKGPRWHRTTNWYGGHVRRRGDIVTFRDTIPVSGVPGRHRLSVRRHDLTLEHSWQPRYVRGLRDTSFTWRLRIRH
ncbi:MAG TPA: hypothetical protein VFM50_02545 [Nocardioidaceae bacterium]|jgi:hypothetical protein|nr:hypothetical protein [Nocardioidaceae bacterium]